MRLTIQNTLTILSIKTCLSGSTGVGGTFGGELWLEVCMLSQISTVFNEVFELVLESSMSWGFWQFS